MLGSATVRCPMRFGLTDKVALVISLSLARDETTCFKEYHDEASASS